MVGGHLGAAAGFLGIAPGQGVAGEGDVVVRLGEEALGVGHRSRPSAWMARIKGRGSV